MIRNFLSIKKQMRPHWLKLADQIAEYKICLVLDCKLIDC